jgi:hypothetical protein
VFLRTGELYSGAGNWYCCDSAFAYTCHEYYIAVQTVIASARAFALSFTSHRRD